MGLGIFSQCNNNSGLQFNGTDIYDQCMYDMGNLATLPEGVSSIYIETKASGSCFFKTSYFYEGYALPGTAPGLYHFIIGFGSSGTCPSLSEGGNWVEQSIKVWYGSFACIWTLTGGVNVNLDNWQQCGDQMCMSWTIFPWGGADDKTKAMPESAPFSLNVPEDGGDYQGPPK